MDEIIRSECKYVFQDSSQLSKPFWKVILEINKAVLVARNISPIMKIFLLEALSTIRSVDSTVLARTRMLSLDLEPCFLKNFKDTMCNTNLQSLQTCSWRRNIEIWVFKDSVGRFFGLRSLRGLGQGRSLLRLSFLGSNLCDIRWKGGNRGGFCLFHGEGRIFQALHVVCPRFCWVLHYRLNFVVIFILLYPISSGGLLSAINLGIRARDISGAFRILWFGRNCSSGSRSWFWTWNISL